MNSPSLLSFSCAVKTNSGTRALENLPQELAGLNAARPLVITDRETIGRRALRTFIRAFGDSGMTMAFFDSLGTSVEPALINELRKAFQEKGCDAIVALGGGTIVEAAKVLNMVLSLKADDAARLSSDTIPRGPLLPFIVVLTADGTGVETSHMAHFNRMEFCSEYLAPNLVVIDRRLTGGPARKIASAGFAALGRAVEAQVSPDRNPFREAYSCAALRFLSEYLKNALTGRGDRKASLAVANAVAMAGCGVSNTDRGLLHKLSRVLLDMQQIHPGVTMAMSLLPALEEYRDKQGFDLSPLLHPLAGDDLFARTPPDRRGQEAFSFVERLGGDIMSALGVDMPRNLREAGVPGYMMEDILEVLGDDPDGPSLCSIAEGMWGEPLPVRKKG